MKSMLLMILVFAVFSLVPKAAGAQVIRIDGSSTVCPITEAVAEEFQKAKKGKMKVTVGIAGTGGGFKKFCRGETDITSGSRPILKSDELSSELTRAYLAYLGVPHTRAPSGDSDR